MRLEPTPDDHALARAVHDRFSGCPGADYIATEFALAHLSALLGALGPKAVLEFGAGIGTITELLLQHPVQVPRITSIETHPYCIEQLRRNLPTGRAPRWELVSDPARLDPAEPYELVIIDGPLDAGHLAFLRPGTSCFVEGNRRATRRALERDLARRGLRCALVNHHRGRRYQLEAGLHPHPLSGRRRLVLRLWRVKKGCWAGTVVSSPGGNPQP